jgi:hypothetical protein
MTPQQKAAQKAAQKGMTPQQKMNAQKAAQAQARASRPVKAPKLAKNVKRQAALNKTRSNIKNGKGPTTITRNNSTVNAVNLNAIAALSATKEPMNVLVETEGPVSPAAVKAKLDASLKSYGASTDPTPKADPTADSPEAAAALVAAEKASGLDKNDSRSATFAAADHKAGDKPFDFASLAANPGVPIELKGRQLYSRFPTLGPGQIIHNLGDTLSGVSYSEFAVEDSDAGGMRIFRVVGTPSQIAASSKTVANRIVLEEIMTGPGGYVTLLRDLDDEEARLQGTIRFYENRIASYEASAGKMKDEKEKKPIQDRLPGLTRSLTNNQAQLAEVQKHIRGFRAARNAAAFMGAPLASTGGSRRHR